MDKRVSRFGIAISGMLTAILTLCMPVAAQTFWRARPANDSIHVSYILGTMHTADAAVLDTLGGFSRALERVSAVYTEIDAAGLSLTPSLLAKAKAPADSTLLRIMTPQQRDTLARYIAAAGLDSAAIVRGFDSFMPAMLDIYLEVQRAAKHGTIAQSMDIAIQQRATAMGKDVRALETATQQMALLVDAPISTQLRSLMENVRDAKKSQTLTEKVVAAYMRQDLAMLGELLENSMTGDYKERMIYGRNRVWTGALAPVMLRENILIAVGAGHLVGAEGLLALLRRLGFEITPVVSDSAPLPEQRQ